MRSALAALGAATVIVLGVLPASARAAAGVVDRTVGDPAIAEASGLAISPQHPGVLWTHDDSGNPPVLFALGRDGRTAARLTLTGVPDVDWEAMAAWRDASGRALLAAADIGDNRARRSRVEIDVVAEPSPLRSTTTRPLRRLLLTYPDGPADAETLLIDPRTQRMFLATKGFASELYAVPARVWPGVGGAAPVDRGTLEPVGSVPLFLVTDGVVLPSGQVLLRTYDSLALLPPLPAPPALSAPGSGGAGQITPLATAALPSEPQGEGLAVDPAGRVYLSSEGVGQPILRTAMPPQIARLIGPATPAAAASGSPAAAASAGPTRVVGSGLGPPALPALPVGLLALLGGLVIAVLAGALTAVARRRRAARRGPGR